MTAQPRKSALKFWLVFGAINIAVYVAGYFLLTKNLCVPPADATAFCGHATKMWPFVLVIPAVYVAFGRIRIALREINDYKAQRNKWGNWRPPQ
jgi:putative flippase GtrA